MKKERLELLLEELSGKLDLLLEMQNATLKMMQGWREESKRRPESADEPGGRSSGEGGSNNSQG